MLDDGVVYQTYFSRENLEFVMLFDRLLDYTPKGGKEGVGIHRHDEYPAAVTASR